MNSRKPNWNKWNLIDDAKVWQVVALSLNINPDCVKSDATDWMAGGLYVNHEGQEFKDRLDIIKANYSKIDATPKTLSMNGIEYCELNISKFAKWAMEKELAIPDELKVLAKVELIAKAEKPLFDKNDLTYPNELDLAVRAWQAVSKIQGKGKPKARIKAWLDENTNLSNEAKNRISIVANWDKLGGATRTTQ